MKQLKILDENAHWWRKQKVDWAIQKGDHWYIIPGSEFPEHKTKDKLSTEKTFNLKRDERSQNISVNSFLLIFLSSLLGVSLALNLFFFFLA